MLDIYQFVRIAIIRRTLLKLPFAFEGMLVKAKVLVFEFR